MIKLSSLPHFTGTQLVYGTFVLYANYQVFKWVFGAVRAVAASSFLNAIFRKLKLDFLNSQHCSPSKVVADFYKYKSDILNLMDTTKIFGVYERKFLKELEEKYISIANVPPTENVAKLLSLGIDFEARGLNGIAISEAIKAEAKNQRSVQNEQL